MDNRYQGVFYTTKPSWFAGKRVSLREEWNIFPKAKTEIQSFIREKMREKELEDTLLDIFVNVWPDFASDPDSPYVTVNISNKAGTANYSLELFYTLGSELKAKFPYASITIPRCAK